MAARRGGPIDGSGAGANARSGAALSDVFGDGSERASGGAVGWDGARVRQLRRFLGASQTELAERLGTRQQTVSEWETGTSRPRRMSRRLLHLVAETSGYYAADPAPGRDDVGGVP